MGRPRTKRNGGEAEFLWLMSLSDLMILLFILFVVLFSFTYKKASQKDFREMAATLRNEPMPADPIENVGAKLNEWIEKEHLSQSMSVVKKDEALLVQISDQLLFSSGDFALNGEGVRVLRALSPILEHIPAPHRLGIEGHTDDSPIHTRTIQDNWDLSAKRSIAVMYALGLSSEMVKRTVVMAFGEMNPIVPNRDPAGRPIAENQAKNRRVTLRVF